MATEPLVEAEGVVKRFGANPVPALDRLSVPHRAGPGHRPRRARWRRQDDAVAAARRPPLARRGPNHGMRLRYPPRARQPPPGRELHAAAVRAL